ncbi:hypothetical protein L7F22_023277 [Adiantum nelumboides]|nr:hypothetical protein [Adiantum nelumboides]
MPPQKRQQAKKQLELGSLTPTSKEKGLCASSPTADESGGDDFSPIQVSKRRQKEQVVSQPTSSTMQSMCSEKEEQEENQVVEIMKGGDVLAKCRVLDVSKCPPIPLCRMFPYPRVQGLRSDISLLKIALEGETYCPEKGIFIVFVVSPLGIAIPVTSDMRASWDAQWQAIDREFENELRTKKGLSFLSNKMLWLSREVLLDMIEKNALRSLEQEIRIAATIEHPINLPNEPSLHVYFASIRYEGKKYIFANIKKIGSKEKSKKKEDQRIQSHLDAASCRLLYRYFLHLRDLKMLVDLPKACKTCVDITNKESTMYGENMITLSPFEIETCPWWIDMPSPHVLPCEKAKFEEWQKSKRKDASGGCLTSQGDQVKGKEVQRGEHAQRGKQAQKGKQAQISETHRTDREIFVDDNSPPLDVGIHGSFHSGPSSRPKPLSQKEYVPPLSTQEGASLDHSIFSFGCGDYISMGKDFASSIRNEDYAKIHTFFSEINKLGVEYKKKKKTVAWAADFVLLDLPMDFTHG